MTRPGRSRDPYLKTVARLTLPLALLFAVSYSQKVEDRFLVQTPPFSERSCAAAMRILVAMSTPPPGTIDGGQAVPRRAHGVLGRVVGLGAWTGN